MRIERRTIEQMVFEESDIKELNMIIGERMGQYEVLELGNQKYICMLALRKDKREYYVLFSFNENTQNPELLREVGII